MKDHVAIAADYQAAVLAGDVPACKWLRLACERNRRDLDRQESAKFPYRFDPAPARKICQMAEMLPHVKGPKAFVTGQDEQGRRIWNKITLEPWQSWLLTTPFGWKRVDDGLRRFRILFPLIPRKNAKSTVAAIVGLEMLTMDGEIGAECYAAATTRDQAKTVAEIAWMMAKWSPDFCEYFGVRVGSETTKTLSVPATGSKFAPLSADANSLDGLNVSFACVDELHAHKTRSVWDVLNTATGARAQPLLMPISTAGVEIGGICHEQLQYLERVLTGAITDETFFGVNYTIDPGDDIRDERVQRKANPNYGVSVKPDDLERKINAAQHSPAALNDVLTKHFNVWIRTESAWMTADLWQKGRTKREREAFLEWLQHEQFPCWIGVDLAEVRDIAAKYLLFQLGPDKYAAFGTFYLPSEAVQKSPIAQLSGWVREGFITETEGNQADFGRIQRDIIADCARFKVREIDFDRALAAQMQQQLKAHFEPSMGRDAVEKFIVTVEQNIQNMDSAMKMTERLVLAQALEHDGNPAMAWMISNVVVERNYKDEIYPRKAGGKDSPNKIDGPVALFTCLSQAMRAAALEPQFQVFFVGGNKAATT